MGYINSTASNTEVKEYLMSMIGNAPHGIVAIDLDGIVTIANTLSIEYLGLDYNVNDVVDCPVMLLARDIPLFRDMMKKVLGRSRMPFDLENVPNRKRYLNIRGRIIPNGLLITIEDVTGRIKTEYALKNRTDELAKLNKELEEFAYISSHDMKSPLASLDGLLTLMNEENAIKEEHKETFELAMQATRQMRKTIGALNDIIALRKTLSIQREKLNFQKVLKEVLLVIHDQVSSSGAVIKTDFSACPYVLYPAIHLKSILQNLITNAIKYSKKDKPPHVTIRTDKEDDSVILEVSDRGLGIDTKQYGHKLYGLFQRFHTHVEGMGVGLHIINSIITSYGGKIEIDSKVNHGTTFKIYLSHA